MRLIISGACMGLAESIGDFSPDAHWQRCTVHFYRNVFSHVPSVKVREIAAMLKAIHASEDRMAADEKALQVIEKLRAQYLTRAAELVEASVHETLAYYTFPEEYWRRIRTSNPLERILREIKRRTKVIAAFPDASLALNLAAARLKHIAGTQWSTKRYLYMQLLKDHEITNATAWAPDDNRSAKIKSAKVSGHYRSSSCRPTRHISIRLRWHLPSSRHIYARPAQEPMKRSGGPWATSANSSSQRNAGTSSHTPGMSQPKGSLV